jgi:hypothetical protein
MAEDVDHIGQRAGVCEHCLRRRNCAHVGLGRSRGRQPLIRRGSDARQHWVTRRGLTAQPSDSFRHQAESTCTLTLPDGPLRGKRPCEHPASACGGVRAGQNFDLPTSSGLVMGVPA